ncbi:diguanylate cyclase [Rhizobium sp. CG5]|uniref:diguanylate cyclase n=1 Tax=Rhizobium sp. CG5 TaxID=2726076 RepID=UPI0020335925|nr:diguanylate cyclase [Rhizobium sp. CG5]MCM2477411.1 diguanylate cyclase [Rhizobium sp. CG5]
MKFSSFKFALNGAWGRLTANSLGASPFATLWAAIVSPFHRSIKARFRYSFAFAMAGLILIGIITIISGRMLIHAYEGGIAEIDARMSPVFVAQDLLYQIETIATNHALGLDVPDVQKSQTIAAGVANSFRTLFEAEATDPLATTSADTLVYELIATWRQSEASLDAVFRQDAGTQKAIDAYAEARTDIANINTLVARFRQLSISELQQRINSGRAIADTSFYFLLGAVLLGLLVLAAVIFFLARSVLEPIGKLVIAADRLGKNDLTYRVKLRNEQDELGQLGEVLNSSTNTLQQLYRELDRRSTYDGLTGVLNRAAFDDRLSSACQTADRGKQRLSLLMIDIDFFKSVNDTHGHQAGDRVLTLVAGALGNAVRPADTIARYGGEEFAVILPDTGATAATAMAERIRAIVEALPIETNTGERILVTVSIGLKTRDLETLPPASLIRLADGALYRAKEAGRNRTFSANEETQPTPSNIRTA